MTVAHRGPVVDAPDLEAALVALREHGLRVSTVRRLMLEALYATDQPLTAEQIATSLGGHSLDQASVYRNLEVLEQAGLVRHFHLPHLPGHYMRAGGGVHEYLVCRSCNAIRAVEPAELDRTRERVREDFGWEAEFTHSPVVGLCPDCARAGADDDGEPAG